MTDSDWKRSADPEVMLCPLRAAGDLRRLRLLACACVRLHWDALDHPRCRRAVEIAELLADRLVGGEDVRSACQAARGVMRQVRWSSPAEWYAGAGRSYLLRAAALAAITANIHQSVLAAVRSTLQAAYLPAVSSDVLVAGREAVRVMGRAVCRLVREVYRSPRPAAPLPAAVLAWDGGTVVRLARAIYAGRDFAALPVLADALEEAGCEDADLVAHLRSPGPHALGCWALDAAGGGP